MQRIPFALLASFALTTFACASANVDTTNLVAESEVVKPSTVLVYDFAVSAKGVTTDSLGPEFMSGTGSHPEREALGRKAASVLAEEIVKQMRERNIPAERANEGMNAPLNAVMLKGQFATVDEGDAMKRMVVGFGAGAAEVKINTQTYQQTEYGPRQLNEGIATAKGSKMPGMAVPIGVGAAAGSVAVSAAVSGGLSATREALGPLTGELDHIAKDIAERDEAFYQRRGWL